MERGQLIENYGKKEQKEWLDNTYLTLTLVQQGIRRKSTDQSDGTVLSLLSDI